MHYDIAQLYHLGKMRPIRDVQSSPRLRADVIVCLDPSGPSGRPCLCAYVGGGHMEEPIPRIYNVQLQGMATLGMTLVGVEVVDGQIFHQVWHCRPLEDKVVIPWTSCPPSSLDLLI